MGRNGRSGVAAALVLAAGLGLAACQGSSGMATIRPHAEPSAGPIITPVPGARNQPASTEVGVAVPDGHLGDVSVVDSAGRPVDGTVRDGTSWVPAHALAYRTTYRATAHVVDSAGDHTATTTFTTAAGPAGDPITSSINVRDGQPYGVGMPISVQFSQPIPRSAQAGVQRRLSVRSDPPQTGAWHWYGDQQVVYRPKVYWRPGTRLTVHTELGGVKAGGGQFDTDRSAGTTIADQLMFQIEDATKQMRVYRDGNLVKTFPVSLGAPETPSSSGNMVIMTREEHALWIYSADDQLDVSYAERLTNDGEYIHAAPWSVADQGHNDVSHGCTNLSMDNAAWVYNNSHIGDPVTVAGTQKHLASGNGWTVWDMSWSDYLKGSALPS